MDNGPLGKRVNYGKKSCKTALEGIKKMEEFNYTSSLGKETLGSKAAGLSEKYENIIRRQIFFLPSSLNGANNRGK